MLGSLGHPDVPSPLIHNPFLLAATPPNAVDRPCLRLKVYVRPTSKYSTGRAGSRTPCVLIENPLSGQESEGIITTQPGSPTTSARQARPGASVSPSAEEDISGLQE